MVDLILGAGYIGARLAELAIEAGRDVVLADNWFATERAQLDGLPARVETVDIRNPDDLARVMPGAERVFLLAAQASRPLSVTDPDYTEETNLSGARRVAEAVAESGYRSLVYASSLHVYGPLSAPPWLKLALAVTPLPSLEGAGDTVTSFTVGGATMARVVSG